MEASASTSSPDTDRTMDSVLDMVGKSCDGVALLKGGGTWQGHVYPGILFLCWGVWWTLHTYKRHLRSQSSGRPFTAQSWYPCLVAGKWLFALEPFLKIIGPPIGISIELYFDSPTGFRHLYCNDTGRFSQQYIHNYQHASSYPAFAVSGIVDFLGLFVNLPPGTEQVFLAMGFGIEGFLMVMHKKHVPLDMVTHALLGYTMLAGALGVILELRSPNNFLVSTFRSFAVIMQGVWLIAMGEMLFTDSKSWNDDYSGPAMMAPPMFGMLTLLNTAGMLMLYVAMDWWHQRQAHYTSLPQTLKQKPVKPEAVDIDEQPHDSSPYSDFALDDSANETSDDGSESPDRQPKPTTTRQQLAVALSMLKPSARQSLGRTPSKSNEHII